VSHFELVGFSVILLVCNLEANIYYLISINLRIQATGFWFGYLSKFLGCLEFGGSFYPGRACFVDFLFIKLKVL